MKTWAWSELCLNRSREGWGGLEAANPQIRIQSPFLSSRCIHGRDQPKTSGNTTKRQTRVFIFATIHLNLPFLYITIFLVYYQRHLQKSVVTVRVIYYIIRMMLYLKIVWLWFKDSIHPLTLSTLKTAHVNIPFLDTLSRVILLIEDNERSMLVFLMSICKKWI